MKSKHKQSWSVRAYETVIYVSVALISIICIYPMLHMVATSFSDKDAVNAGLVHVLPVGFNLDAYRFVMQGDKFLTAFWISVKRTILGVLVNMIMIVLTGYPLSKTTRQFSFRTKYMWFFVFTMLFSGGMIPAFIVVNKLGLMNSMAALILPSALPVYYLILFQNYVKSLPYELSEAAYIDGAGEIKVLCQVILPLSKPMLATLVLFCAVSHWNAWFDGLIYMSREYNYPLQTYLRTVVVQSNMELATNLSLDEIKNVVPENTKAAQIVLAMLPILMVYPFLQKHFTKGIVMGSVKG
ncbi:MAG: carbohydrate ABC transporter permease [Clostridia bacterium]|nr:carbohydrate ABC transporter permease [Clostridia bacterium]